MTLSPHETRTLESRRPAARIDCASLVCPNCAIPLVELTSDSPALICSCCGSVVRQDEGIWRCLDSDQESSFQRFVAEYEFIRAAESRGSLDPAYYPALPFKDLTGKLTEQWKIRAHTFRFVERRILRRYKRPLRVLDLGAGNGWLSYRLALLGHDPVAVDLLINSTDGLGAAKHFAAHLPSMFPRVQASLERLPFANESFDLAIYNASFHYSEDYVKTLAEALRCMRPGGAIVIADTPWYRREQSGLQMIAEKRTSFLAAYGFASKSLASLEFLTPERLDHMAIALNLKWQVHRPFYGLAWALRPLHARLERRRTPSKFRIFVAELTA